MKMRWPIVDSIVGCSNTAAYRGSEIDLFPCRGKTIRKRMTNRSVGLKMAPLVRHRKQWDQSRLPDRVIRARHGSEFDAERSPAVHLAMYRDGEWWPNRATQFAGELV